MKIKYIFYILLVIGLGILINYIYTIQENFKPEPKAKDKVKAKTKVAIITANYGSYDIPKFHANVLNAHLVDWYCFTDNSKLETILPKSMWKVINKPYHINLTKSNELPNCLPNENKQIHNMMSAKFYKACTHKIPELVNYDYFIWIDGSIYLRDGFVNEMLKLIAQGHKLINFSHEKK